MQRRGQQQLLTCNTPCSKYHSWCFITYSVLTGKKKHFFYKKNNGLLQSVFTLRVSSLSFMLLIMLFNNLPISLDGPLNCIICTHVIIKVETYYILLKPKLKIKFYTRWNRKWFGKYVPNSILSFFSFT